MKKKDLFVTDSRFEPLDGFFEDDLYEVHSWDDAEYQSILAYVNYLNERN